MLPTNPLRLAVSKVAEFLQLSAFAACINPADTHRRAWSAPRSLCAAVPGHSLGARPPGTPRLTPTGAPGPNPGCSCRPLFYNIFIPPPPPRGETFPCGFSPCLVLRSLLTGESTWLHLSGGERQEAAPRRAEAGKPAGEQKSPRKAAPSRRGTRRKIGVSSAMPACPQLATSHVTFLTAISAPRPASKGGKERRGRSHGKAGAEGKGGLGSVAPPRALPRPHLQWVAEVSSGPPFSRPCPRLQVDSGVVLAGGKRLKEISKRFLGLVGVLFCLVFFPKK